MSKNKRRKATAEPVTAAAVVLPRDFPREILKDSKKLSPTARVGLGWRF
ncbi:MAG: hypothetical protein FWC36_01550 [Spirochaetes bacterium]|nr:hypothetical protein [Spirochaetota bacterium]